MERFEVHEGGITRREIATRLGINEASVYTILQRYKIKPVSRIPSTRFLLYGQDAVDICIKVKSKELRQAPKHVEEMHKLGYLSTDELCKKYGKSEKALLRIFRKRGIKPIGRHIPVFWGQDAFDFLDNYYIDETSGIYLPNGCITSKTMQTRYKIGQRTVSKIAASLKIGTKTNCCTYFTTEEVDKILEAREELKKKQCENLIKGRGGRPPVRRIIERDGEKLYSFQYVIELIKISGPTCREILRSNPLGRKIGNVTFFTWEEIGTLKELNAKRLEHVAQVRIENGRRAQKIRQACGYANHKPYKTKAKTKKLEDPRKKMYWKLSLWNDDLFCYTVRKCCMTQKDAINIRDSMRALGFNVWASPHIRIRTERKIYMGEE